MVIVVNLTLLMKACPLHIAILMYTHSKQLFADAFSAASVSNKSIRRWCNTNASTSSSLTPDEKIHKSQHYRRRMQRRRVALPPRAISHESENRNSIPSLSETVAVINKFTPVASFNKKMPSSYAISSKHYGGGVSVANSLLQRASKKRRYEEKIIIGNAAVDSHQRRHHLVNDRVVKRFQMNHKEKSPSKFGMNIFNGNCFHLSEYNFSRSTIQFLGALCQQGKSLNVYTVQCLWSGWQG